MKFLLLTLVAVASAKYPCTKSPNWVGRDPSVHIVGGTEAPVAAYPWQLGLERCTSSGCRHSCGAVLIAPTWALTAAHCVTSTALSGYNFVAGQHKRNTIPRGDPRRLVPDKITQHPLYRRDPSAGFPNDIAIVRFGKAAPVDGRTIAPASLPPTHPTDFTKNECWISGWGRLGGGGALPIANQHARISVLSTADCRTKHGSRIQEYHICIFDHESQSRGACNGDSGGPLQCKVGSGWQVAGLTSWGRSGCPPAFPSVYVRTSYFRNWIREQSGVYEEQWCE